MWRYAVSAVTAVGAAGLAAVVTACPAAAAQAARGGVERITDMAITYELRVDGSMHVTEAITYDFGPVRGRHGLERHLPEEFTYDAERNRVYPITDVRAKSPTGAPDDVELLDPDVTIRIGNKDKTVAGVQGYVLEYDVAGVVNTVGGGQELYWNATGHDWSIPIERVSVTVTGPGAAVQKATCYQGIKASDPCLWSVSGGSATYRAPRTLQPKEDLTVVAGFPSGTFPDAAPILRDRWTFGKAFAASPIAGGASLAVLLALVGGTGLLVAQRGRDRRYLGLIPGLTPGSGDEGRTARVGWRRLPVAVRFTPPDQLRVGELGTLIDEQANVEDVTATIIDLAVRGYLRIEELGDEPDGEFDQTDPDQDDDDWALIRTGKSLDGLYGYEIELFDALFNGRDRVRLSALRTTFGTDLRRVQTLLYDEVTRRGWFRGNPRSVRALWRGYGVTLIVVGVVATVLLAIFTQVALVGVAVVIGGVVVTALAGRMPSRTAAGTAQLAQAQGFRLYLETAEANQLRFEEGKDIFSRYLPYAIVFGVAQRWADLFADLAASGASLPEPTWYTGYGPAWGSGGLDYHHFGGSMAAFSTETTSSISAVAPATPSSSGASGFDGGFSGGGGGGGGGGSW